MGPTLCSWWTRAYDSAHLASSTYSSSNSGHRQGFEDVCPRSGWRRKAIVRHDFAHFLGCLALGPVPNAAPFLKAGKHGGLGFLLLQLLFHTPKVVRKPVFCSL